MSTVKISQLPLIAQINANTSNTLFAGVDVPTGVTGKMTAHTLAQGLYSNEILNVGANPVLFSNTVSQFSGSDPQFLQINLQNFNANGSSDYIITGDQGTNSNNYIDLGLNGSNFQTNPTVGSVFLPNDGYLYVQGPGANYQGNLTLGTASSNTHVNFIIGGANAQNVVAKMTTTGLVLNTQSSLTFSDGSVQNTAAVPVAYSQASFALSNTNLGSINTLNSEVSALQGNVSTLQTSVLTLNTNVTSSQANTITTQGVDATQNTIIQSAYNQANLANSIANTSVQNTANIILPGNVTFNGANTNFNSNIVTYGTMTTTGNVITTGNLTATGPVIFNGLFTNNGNTINNGNMTTTGNVISVGYLTANGQTTFNGNTSLNGYVSVANNLTVNNVFTINVSSQLLTMTGIVTIQSSIFPANSSGVRIDGSNNGVAQATTSTGTMLQIIGLDAGYATRVLLDNYSYGNTNAYPLFAARAARGNSSNPAPVQTNDLLFRIAGNGYGNTYTLLGGGAFDVVALENYTDATKGSQINLTTTPIGTNTRYTTVAVNTSVVTVNTNLTVANTIQYNASINNGTVTQLTSKSTAVTLNGRTGQITTNNAPLNKGVAVQFTVNNNFIVSAKDVVIVNIASGASVGYDISINSVTPGSFIVNLHNSDSTPSGSNASDTLVINFAIIRVA